MRERNNFTYRHNDVSCGKQIRKIIIGSLNLFVGIIIFTMLLSAVALCQTRIQKSIRINPGISTDDAPPTRLHYNGYLHDLYVEFTITPADQDFQPLLWLWWAPEWTDYYGVPIPGQMDAIEEYRPQLNTYVEEYLGQGYFAVAPEHGGGIAANYPYTLSWRAFVDGIRIWGLGMPGDSLICDSANFDVYYDYYDNGMPCHSFWNVCWEFYIFNLSTFDKPLTDRITQGKVNEIRFDGEVIDHRVSTPPPYWCPVVDPVTATIIKGDKYAHLCTETDTASQITGLAYQEALYLEVDRDVPDTADQYCVVQTSTRNFTRTDTVYYLPHDTLFVTCEPKQLYTGDTAIIHIHQRFDGVVDTNEYFQSREIGILGNDYYGTLLDEWGDTATYFQNVTGQLWFIAAQDLDADSVCAKIRVGLAPSIPMCSVVPVPKEEKKPMPAMVIKTKDGGKKYVPVINKQFKQKTKNASPQTTDIAERVKPTNPKGTRGAKPAGLIKKSGKIKDIQFQYTQAGSDSIPIKSCDILLGQTKYYWAESDPTDDKRLIINESETIPDTSTQPNALEANFSVTKDNNDDKLGVYYEYKDSTGTAIDSTMFIRFIGRYWTPTKDYKVHLYATALDRRQGDIAIEVKKPSKLGNSHPTVRDVFNNRCNLDSLIIKYAGENGIPPQLIKGQIERETHFNPDWRYEPAQDFSYQSPSINTTVFPTNAPFWKTIENPKAESWPYSHTHVTPTSYIDSVISIGAYIAGDNNTFSKYRIINTDSIMGFKDLTDKLRKIKLYYQREEALELDDARKAAYDSLGREIKDTSDDIGKEYNIIAQTRIVSSYGFVQMMYTTAFGTSFGVETNNRYGTTGTIYMARMDSTLYPEKLNEIDYAMPRYCDFLLTKLNSLFPSLIPESQWSTTNNCNGFEACWKKAIQKYNPRDVTYSTGVMNNSKNYLPH